MITFDDMTSRDRVYGAFAPYTPLLPAFVPLYAPITSLCPPIRPLLPAFVPPYAPITSLCPPYAPITSLCPPIRPYYQPLSPYTPLLPAFVPLYAPITSLCPLYAPITSLCPPIRPYYQPLPPIRLRGNSSYAVCPKMAMSVNTTKKRCAYLAIIYTQTQLGLSVKAMNNAAMAQPAILHTPNTTNLLSRGMSSATIAQERFASQHRDRVLGCKRSSLSFQTTAAGVVCWASPITNTLRSRLPSLEQRTMLVRASH